MTEPTDPAALSDEVATAIAWLRDHAATDDFGRDFSRNKRHGAIADLLTRLSARVTEAERNLAVANDELSCCQVELEQLENIEEEKITAERRLETARADALEEAAKACDAEETRRAQNAVDAERGSEMWGEPKAASMAQWHKALTAQSLAKAIRSLAALQTPRRPER